MKAARIKNWCLENITPQSWSRIVLRILPELRSRGYELKDVENPSEDLELPDDLVQIIENTIDDLYQLKIDQTVA